MSKLNFEEFAQIYNPNTEVDSFEYKNIHKEFNLAEEKISKLDKTKDYNWEELKVLLFDGKEINSQTTFYKTRRMYSRMMTISGFNFKVVNQLSKIEYEDIFDYKSFSKSFFKDYKDLSNEIEKIQKMSVENNRTPTMALVSLMWSGLSLVESTNLLVIDVNLPAKEITLKDSCIPIIDEVSKAIDKHLSSRNIKSDYVFCGRSGDKAHITTTNKMITSLNAIQDERKFVSKNIYYSGLFYRTLSGTDNIDNLCRDIKLKYYQWLKSFY